MSPRVWDIGVRTGEPVLIDVEFVGVGGQRTRAQASPDIGEIFSPESGARAIEHHINTRNTPGTFWSLTGWRHLPYESWLEARWLLLLDHDPRVVELMTQPLTVRGVDSEGALSHTPDIFVRLVNGRGKLIDVKSRDGHRSDDLPRRARLAAATARDMGWDYHFVTEPPHQRERSVAWLAQGRRPVHAPAMATAILRRAAAPTPLGIAWQPFVGNPLHQTVAFNLLWQHKLGMDYRAPLGEETIVWAITT